MSRLLKPGGQTDDKTHDGPEVAPVIDVRKPNFPPGKFVHLPDRGDLLVRDFGGPADAPTIMLLHGCVS